MQVHFEICPVQMRDNSAFCSGINGKHVKSELTVWPDLRTLCKHGSDSAENVGHIFGPNPFFNHIQRIELLKNVKAAHALVCT